MTEKQPLNSMGIVNDTVTGMMIANDEVDQPHGDWLIVKCRSRNKSPKNQRIRGKDMTPNNKHDLNIWGNNRKEYVNPFIPNNFKHMNGTQGDIGPSNRDRTSNSKQKKKRI